MGKLTRGMVGLAAALVLLGWLTAVPPGMARAVDVVPAAGVSGAPIAWGLNANGQVGDGTQTNRTTPTWTDRTGVLAGHTVARVAAGEVHSCALTATGALACWGRNDKGQLGIGTFTNQPLPRWVYTGGVLAGKVVVDVSAGVGHTCALTADGVVACWGENSSGELGDGTSTDSARPVLVDRSGVLAGKTAVALSAGAYHSCALTSDGNAACWGYNMYGQLGNGTTSMDWGGHPVLVDRAGALAGRALAQVSAGRFHTCALATDRTLACWGQGDYGQLGNGSLFDQSRPALVDQSGALAGKAVASLVSGDLHSCAVATDNTLACWGLGSSGQLGDGTSSTQTRPILVDRTGALAGKAIAQLAAGGYHSCALASDGAVACWGANSDGQLGNGTTASQARPASVVAGGALAHAQVIRIEGGGWHTLAWATTVPDAPTGVTATRGNGSLTMGFIAPAFNGGVPIVNYKYSTDGGSTWVARSPASTTSPLVISGLTNGTTYQVRVLAVNALGDGAASAAVTGTPSTVPGAPTGLTAVPGVGTLTIHFTPPTSDGGAPITNYLYSINFGSTWLTRTPASGASPLVITGLTNGVAYGVKLLAVNAAGEGPPSALVIGKPADVPSEPTKLVATPGDASASVSFVGPVSNGGASVTNYQYSTDGGATWKVRNPASTASPILIGGLVNGQTYQVKLRAVNSSGAGAASAAVSVMPLAAGSLVFVPVGPDRVVDTRTPTGANALAAGETRELSVAKAGGVQVVPPGVAAVAYNLTVPNPTANGHLRVEPGDAKVLTTASAVNFLAGQTIANGLTAKVSPTGTLKLYNGSAGPAEAIIDIVGYFLPAGVASEAQRAAGRLTPVTPVRVYSSDAAGGPTPSLATTTVNLAAAVPTGASAVAYNITVVGPEQPGHLRVFPAGASLPNASTVNFIAGDRVANGTAVKVSAGRAISVYNGSAGPVNFLVDVVGYYSATGGFFHTVDPVRVMSTRTFEGGAGAIPAVSQRTVDVWHTQATPQSDVVPSGTAAIDYNMTAVATGSVGHLRIWPAGKPLVGASALNWPGAGYTRANASVVAVSAAREVKVYNGSGAPTDVLIDINGYYK